MACSNCHNPRHDENSGEPCIECGSYGFLIGRDPESAPLEPSETDSELDAHEIRKILDRDELSSRSREIPEETRNQVPFPD